MENCITKIADKCVDKVEDLGVRAIVGITMASTKKTRRIRKAVSILVTSSLALGAVAMGACAAETDPEAFISQITDLLKTWIPRLGAMIIVVGGIQLGIGFKDDNADGKTRGMQCMIGGAIVAAIGGMVEF